MTTTKEIYSMLGEMVLEEVLVRSGMARAHTGSAADISLTFAVAVDGPGNTLTVSTPRTGKEPLLIAIQMSE